MRNESRARIERSWRESGRNMCDLQRTDGARTAASRESTSGQLFIRARAAGSTRAARERAEQRA